MTRPLSFLHLTTFYPPYSFGGDAIYIHRLAHSLGEAGHNVDVAHCVDAYHVLHPADPEIPFEEHPKVQRHELRSQFRMLSPLLTHQTGHLLLKRRQVQQILDRKRYDVVHYHNISLLGPEALTLRPRHGAALKLYTAHDHWLVCPMHALWKFQRRPCDGPECLRCSLLNNRPPQLWRRTGLLHRACRHVDRFFSPSDFSIRMHAQRGFPDPMVRLPYFLKHVEKMRTGAGSRPHNRPYFLFVGRLELIKGLQTLISFWKNVSNVDLLVAGTGSFETSLRDQASSNPRIRFLGAMSQDRLPHLYSHALACIVPSVTYETFGIVCIEAFARKTPVIVRNLGAMPEIVRESGGGFIYGNDQELETAIQLLSSSPDLRSKLGEKGHRAFLQQWSEQAHLKMYLDHIHQLFAERLGRVRSRGRAEAALARAVVANG